MGWFHASDNLENEKQRWVGSMHRSATVGAAFYTSVFAIMIGCSPPVMLCDSWRNTENVCCGCHAVVSFLVCHHLTSS